MRKIPLKSKWRVYGLFGKVYAKSTTKKKAQAQLRLLKNIGV